MSWQLGAFAILAVALAGGFAWYERAHPDTRTIALVATMAAFAALGRIAFAALPNVKPSTDIILATGFALGPAPGFVVGAVTALVSNFFFGQGPWTVWQMAGWALTGLLGAGLAHLAGGRIRRWPLAAVCGIVGYAFAAFQDVGDWVTYSDHSPGALGAYVGQGTGFDIVHAVGCVVFALAIGPWLIGSLQRFRRRLEISWGPAEPAGLAALALAVVLGAGALGAPALGRLFAAAPARAAGSPTGYLLGAQNADGGFGATPGAPSTQLYAGWAGLGLAAEGINPASVRHGGASLLAYVAAGVPALSDPGSLERTILVVRAAGADAYSFAGHDLVAQLQGEVRRNGSVAGQVNLTSFAVLALRAAGAPVGAATVAWLRAQQNGDGGFAFATAGAASDVDDTGAALEALAGTGPASAHAIARAVGFIRSAQNGDGGLPSSPGGPSDAQSTAWAVQGLIAAGVDPGALMRRGRSPLDYLRGLIAPDGHVRYAAGTDQTPVWVTGEALMALAGRPLPLAPVPAATPATSAPPPARHRRSHRRPAKAAAAAAAARHRAAHHRRRAGRAHAAPLTPWAVLPLAAADETAVIGVVHRVLGAVGVAAG